MKSKLKHHDTLNNASIVLYPSTQANLNFKFNSFPGAMIYLSSTKQSISTHSIRIKNNKIPFPTTPFQK